MANVSIKVDNAYSIEYRKQTVQLATKMDASRFHTMLLWKVGERETEAFVLRTKYIKKHGLLKAVEAAVNADKMPKDVLFYLRRLQETIGE